MIAEMRQGISNIYELLTFNKDLAYIKKAYTDLPDITSEIKILNQEMQKATTVMRRHLNSLSESAEELGVVVESLKRTLENEHQKRKDEKENRKKTRSIYQEIQRKVAQEIGERK